MLNVSGGTVRTVDHDEIRDWIEEHDGHPAKLEGRPLTGGNLRIDFEGETIGEELEQIPWEDFFGIFDEEGLVFEYQQHSPENDDKRPNKQKFELVDGERGAMQDELGSEMDDIDVRNNTKETAGGDENWRNTGTAEKHDSMRGTRDES